MTKINEILNDKESVLAFDMDGVLSKMEFGEYNHFAMNDEEWALACKEGENLYPKEAVIKKMQKFLKTRNMDNIYVISKVYNDKESQMKDEFLTKYYKIKKENIYYVNKNNDKLAILKEIKKKYPKLEDYRIAMVEDSVDVLNDIMRNTNYSTIHISSFID